MFSSGLVHTVHTIANFYAKFIYLPHYFSSESNFLCHGHFSDKNCFERTVEATSKRFSILSSTKRRRRHGTIAGL